MANNASDHKIALPADHPDALHVRTATSCTRVSVRRPALRALLKMVDHVVNELRIECSA